MSNWNKDNKREDGNFTRLIDFLSEYSADLKSHLQGSPRNARYMSPKIHSEFICHALPFESLMAKENYICIHTTEQLYQNWKVHFLPRISCHLTPPSCQTKLLSELNLSSKSLSHSPPVLTAKSPLRNFTSESSQIPIPKRICRPCVILSKRTGFSTRISTLFFSPSVSPC